MRAGPGMGMGGWKMPSKEDDDKKPEPAGDEQVFRYRYDELRKRGVEHRDAQELAEQNDVVHKIDRLLAGGCSPGQAARIIL